MVKRWKVEVEVLNYVNELGLLGGGGGGEGGAVARKGSGNLLANTNAVLKFFFIKYFQ